MESILMSTDSEVRAGLARAIEAAIGPHEFVQVFVPIQIALLIVEIAKRAPDVLDWFPKGKWATLQAIESRINQELDELKFGVESATA